MLAALLFVGLAQGAPDSRRIVQASEIMEKIERGEPVHYDGVIVEGDLDLSGRTLGTVHFNDTVFRGPVNFRGTNFTRDAWFLRAKFRGGDAYFRDSQFNGYTGFNKALFGSGASFERARFNGYTTFNNVRFNETAHFWRANFTEDAYFEGAQFIGWTDFNAAKFCKIVYFRYATFSEDVVFGRTLFQGYADFWFVQFNGTSRFGDAQFDKDTQFSKVRFGSDSNFGGVRFGGDAYFGGTEFNKTAHFDGAVFSGGVAYFMWANFSGNARFWEVKFKEIADFSDTTFNGSSGFRYAQFSNRAYFNSAMFNGSASFEDAQFDGNAYFENTTFGSHLDLTRTGVLRLLLPWESIDDHQLFVSDDDAYLALIRNYANLGWFEDLNDCYYEYRNKCRMNEPISLEKITDTFEWILYGYGVKPLRTVVWIVSVILGFGLVFSYCGSIKKYIREERVENPTDGPTVNGTFEASEINTVFKSGELTFFDPFIFSLIIVTFTLGFASFLYPTIEYRAEKHRFLIMLERFLGYVFLALLITAISKTYLIR